MPECCLNSSKSIPIKPTIVRGRAEDQLFSEITEIDWFLILSYLQFRQKSACQQDKWLQCYIDSNNAQNDCASLLQTCKLTLGWWKIHSKQSSLLSETVTNSDMLLKFPLIKYFIMNVWLVDLRSNQLFITDHLLTEILHDRLGWVFCSVTRITCTLKFLPELHGCSIIFRCAGCTLKMKRMLELNFLCSPKTNQIILQVMYFKDLTVFAAGVKFKDYELQYHWNFTMTAH